MGSELTYTLLEGCALRNKMTVWLTDMVMHLDSRVLS